MGLDGSAIGWSPSPRRSGWRRAIGLIVAAIAILGLAAGCRGADTPAGDGIARGEITVAAAASLTGVFDRLARQFEADYPGTRVRISYASSAALAQQIEHGAPVDVFASADVYSMADAVMAGRAADPVAFATNQLAVITPPGNPAGLRSWREIASPGLRVALCIREAPCGLAARQLLERAGLNEPRASAELDVRAVLTRVESGEADVGIVYATDARSAGSQVLVLPVSAAENVTTEYQIARINDAGNPAGAEAFAAYVAFNAGAQQMLREAGFGPAPSPTTSPTTSPTR